MTEEPSQQLRALCNLGNHVVVAVLAQKCFHLLLSRYKLNDVRSEEVIVHRSFPGVEFELERPVMSVMLSSAGNCSQ